MKLFCRILPVPGIEKIANKSVTLYPSFTFRYEEINFYNADFSFSFEGAKQITPL